MTHYSPERPLRLGTRASPLAMAQAHMVRDALLAAHGSTLGWSQNHIEIISMTASGDKILDRALADAGGKALWTRELDVALADGRVDITVHSMKDVETIRPDAFMISAVLPRADVRDVLIGAQAIDDLPRAARFGTASPRRAAQALRLRPDLDISLLRGNVQTRLDKVANGSVDATLLAAAGLARLDMADVGSPQSFADFLPAPSQGVVGIETRVDDVAAQDALAPINDVDSYFAVMVERRFLAALQADCHSALAAHCAQNDAGGWTLRAELLTQDGSDFVLGSCPIVDIADADDLAADMLGRASPEIRSAFGAALAS
jgi:hydroxymethylbilane synthase